MSVRNLDSLLQPRSVVLIGASATEGSVGYTIARNLLRAGFQGPVLFVNPHHTELLGQPCHRSIAALPLVPDLAVIATPPATVPGIIAELSAKGVRAGVVVTAGLDAELKMRMLEAAKPNLFRILGPNGIGLMLPHLGLDASFAHRAPSNGDLAFLSQSGALVTSVIDWAAAQAIGFSHVVSLGDMADVDFGDLLDYLAGDVRSRAILLYMEALTEAPKFLSAARRAARVKPVVVIKSGRHAAAAKAAASHTGRLAGSDAAYDAAFRRSGVLRVYNLLELFEAAEILARVPRLTSEYLTILTNGGGAGVLAADRLADFDGRMAELSKTTRAKLDAALPPTWSKANPIDIIGDADAARFTAAIEIALQDPAQSALLVLNCPTALSSSTAIAEAVVATIGHHRATALQPKPILTSWLGRPAAAEARRLFAANGIATFDTPEAAAQGFMYLVRHARAQEELMQMPSAVGDIDEDARVRAGRILADVEADGRTLLTEAEAKSVVAAYGIPVVETVVAATPADVAVHARRLLAQSASVVVKIHSRDISHKSDVGGVALDLSTPEEAAAAATRMNEKISSLRPDARLDGFTVSPMIRRPNAHELIIGMSVDATFGPLIMFGAGGTAVEVMRDTALALPPLDTKLARDLMRATRIHRLLEGYRDRKPADLDAVAHVLVRVSQLIADHPRIAEIDINPLLADENGAIALDARVGILKHGAAARAPMSIRPYPREWEKRISCPGIGDILLRPIRPEDEQLYEDFMALVKPEDHRSRFFAAKHALSHRFVAGLTQIDYARDMAFCAIDEASGRLLGVARYSADPDRTTAEYAVLVRSDLKGKGLGWILMQHLIEHARATGIGTLAGLVLVENATMLRMCNELGFKATTDKADPSVCQVVLELAAPRASG